MRAIELATDPGDMVLDPFVGSGTTAAVAYAMGRECAGVDIDPRSYSYLRQRIDDIGDMTLWKTDKLI